VVVVVGSWINLKKLTRARLEVAKEPLPEAWTTMMKKLARQLEKKKLKLVEDGL
jgi:hypothetical protein